jgi:hypothetical protein
VTQAPPRAAPPLEYCPTCGAEVSQDQEYCLDCGRRLPGSESGMVPRMAAAWRRRLPWYPGDWIWPAALGLVLAAAGAAAAIVYARSTSSSNATIVATGSRPAASPASVARPATDTGAVAPVFTPTVKVDTSQARLQPPGNATTTSPTATGTPARTAPTRPARAKGGLTPWPAGRSGYTVVLESVPSGGGGAAAAQRKARQALAGGLANVGVLDSGQYSSLHPGYAVVFSGIYATLAQAQTAAAAAQAKGFPSAYARQITT